MATYITAPDIGKNQALITGLVQMFEAQVIQRVLGTRPIVHYYLATGQKPNILVMPMSVEYIKTANPKEFSEYVAKFYKELGRTTNELVRYMRALDAETLRTYGFTGYTLKGNIHYDKVELQLSASVQDNYIVQTAIFPIYFVFTLERK